ncbi:MAG: SgcJ/EcaC family oxidoreductase [Chitinophagales bacterium]
MKLSSFIKVNMTIAMSLFTTIALSQSKLDTTSIQNILREEVVAWNNGDATAYSKHFAEDGTFTNILGMFFTGHKAFLDRHEEIFKGRFRKTVLEQKIVSLKFVGSNAAIVETLTWLSGFSNEGPPTGTHLDDKGRLYTRLLQIMTKNGADWEIMTYHNVDLKPGTTLPK